MNKKLIEYITDSTKRRIIIDVQLLGQVTTKQLLERNPEIPQATLYRLLKKMVADEILKVVAENRVRNVTEKVYAFAFESGDFNTELEKMLAENPGEAYYAIFSQFMMGLMDEVKSYSMGADVNLRADGVGIMDYPFYGTIDEVGEIAAKIHALMQPYLENEPTPERQLRSMARIMMPPKEKKEERKS